MSKRVRVTVELDVEAEPITGRVWPSGGGRATEFNGYVELMAALVSAQASPQERGNRCEESS
jgi:hypothetical protein